MSAARAPLGRIVSARDAGLYRSAAEALEAARLQAIAMRATAGAAIAAEREAMRRSLAAEADMRAARQLAEGAARVQACLAGLHRDVADTIATAIGRVLGGLDVAEAVAAAAAHAMADLDARHGIAVHVHPACAVAARAALEGSGARVVSDEMLPQDACTLETEAGIVRAGLSDQMAVLRAALLDAADAVPAPVAGGGGHV